MAKKRAKGTPLKSSAQLAGERLGIGSASAAPVSNQFALQDQVLEFLNTPVPQGAGDYGLEASMAGGNHSNTAFDNSFMRGPAERPKKGNPFKNDRPAPPIHYESMPINSPVRDKYYSGLQNVADRHTKNVALYESSIAELRGLDRGLGKRAGGETLRSIFSNPFTWKKRIRNYDTLHDFIYGSSMSPGLRSETPGLVDRIATDANILGKGNIYERLENWKASKAGGTRAATQSAEKAVGTSALESNWSGLSKGAGNALNDVRDAIGGARSMGSLFKGEGAVARGAVLGAAALPAGFAAINAFNSIRDKNYGAALGWTAATAGAAYGARKLMLGQGAAKLAAKMLK